MQIAIPVSVGNGDHTQGQLISAVATIDHITAENQESILQALMRLAHDRNAVIRQHSDMRTTPIPPPTSPSSYTPAPNPLEYSTDLYIITGLEEDLDFIGSLIEGPLPDLLAFTSARGA